MTTVTTCLDFFYNVSLFFYGRNALPIMFVLSMLMTVVIILHRLLFGDVCKRFAKVQHDASYI